MNCDGLINFADINPFVLALSNPATWQAAYPGCPVLNGDINGDGVVSFRDINPFVALLGANRPPRARDHSLSIPCPTGWVSRSTL